jgi:hypothetical protein
VAPSQFSARKHRKNIALKSGTTSSNPSSSSRESTKTLPYAGAMFHDLGLAPQYASADKRFEVDVSDRGSDILHSAVAEPKNVSSIGVS